jgi:phosphoglycerate dehydrogenase-like enzyme
MLPPLPKHAGDWARRISDALPEYDVVLADDEVAARRGIPNADAAYGVVPPDLLPLASKLRWLQVPVAGPKKGFYYPELVIHPVVICNPRGVYNDHIGQHIMMFVLALARGLPYYMDAQREERWDADARKSRYIELSEATALIVGVGGIGHETARLCNSFGMRVLGTDSRWEHPTPDMERHAPEDLDELLPQADFVIVTVPHTPSTEGMWHAARFALMAPDAYFINIGRGATTKLDDLVEALENRRIAGCALDVFEEEPLPTTHKLWKLPNVILTPHAAIYRAENITERWFALLLDNARRFAADKPLRNVVDKSMWF